MAAAGSARCNHVLLLRDPSCPPPPHPTQLHCPLPLLRLAGVVHQATWRGGCVAVKRVQPRSREQATTFVREVEALALLRHPHVMQLYAACMRPPGDFWLVCELLRCGGLGEVRGKASVMGGLAGQVRHSSTSHPRKRTCSSRGSCPAFRCLLMPLTLPASLMLPTSDAAAARWPSGCTAAPQPAACRRAASASG